MQNVLASIACVDILGVSALVFALLSAPYGFEDEKGFHLEASLSA
jgi:hypothetical protein